MNSVNSKKINDFQKWAIVVFLWSREQLSTFINIVHKLHEHFTMQYVVNILHDKHSHTSHELNDTTPQFRTATKQLQSIECKCKIFSQYCKKWFSHFYPECTRSQQDLTLTQVNKLTCTHHRLRWHSEPTKCFVVLTLHCQQSSLPLKMAAWYPDFCLLSVLHLVMQGIA